LLFLFVVVGVEGPSKSAATTLMETSNSSLSPGHQSLSEGVSPRISTSFPEFDSQEVGLDDEGIIQRIMFLNYFLKE
jgi:hypothetical protein